MDFIFQGFQSSLPFWVYLLIFILTSALAWWSYKDITGIRRSFRYILISARSLVFFILLLLLVNPFIKTEVPYYEQPRFLVMLDNSASTGIEKSEYKGTETYRELLDKLRFEDSTTINYDFFLIGSETQASNPMALSFDSDQTNLFSAIQELKSNQSEANAAVLISDGIYTMGQNPVFEASNLDMPVFTIGLGDTTFQKDVLVTSVSTNSTGYLNSTHTVSATVSSKGFKSTSFPVELRKDNEIIASKSITPDISNSSQEVIFDLPLKEKGLQQYKVHIPTFADEWSDSNNMQRFSIDVKDAKQQILSLAFEVHPDVKFIRSLLLGDQNTSLTRRTWIRNNRFIEGSFSVDPDTLDLAIIHGYPPSGLSNNMQQRITELAEKAPLVVVATPLFNPLRFEQQVTSLPASIKGSWDFVSVSIAPGPKATSHPIMELPPTTFDRIPSLSAPVNNLDTAPGSINLFSSSFQGQKTGKPIVTVQELGNRRFAFITGHDWFRLAQNSNPEIREFTRQLWLNIISWTSTNPDSDRLEVQPAQTSFAGSESVIINAFLNNERGALESDATIDISVMSDSLETRFYTMENRGPGQYRLDLGTMPEDVYSFEATAKKEDRVIDTQKGEFAVEHSNAEYLDINRNGQVLRQISERSGGEYMPYDSVAGFWNLIEKRELLNQQEEIQANYFYPYQQIAWFFIVLILLSGEWIFRKYLSLP